MRAISIFERIWNEDFLTKKCEQTNVTKNRSSLEINCLVISVGVHQAEICPVFCLFFPSQFFTTQNKKKFGKGFYRRSKRGGTSQTWICLKVLLLPQVPGWIICSAKKIKLKFHFFLLITKKYKRFFGIFSLGNFWNGFCFSLNISDLSV